MTSLSCSEIRLSISAIRASNVALHPTGGDIAAWLGLRRQKGAPIERILRVLILAEHVHNTEVDQEDHHQNQGKS